MVKSLKSQLKATESKIESLLDALEDRQSADLILSRIEKRQAEKALIEEQIKDIEFKSTLLTEDEIAFFLNKLKNGEIDNKEYRRKLVDILINKIIVNDNEVTIIMNASNHPICYDLTALDEIKAISSISDGSTGSGMAPPAGIEPATNP